MALEFLRVAGDLVKGINLSMLPSPPPKVETGSPSPDVCYLGPNGEEGDQYVTYCKDLPPGQRGMVGSWYLHPERHVIEYVAFVAISYAIIRRVLPTLSQCPETKKSDLNPPLLIKACTFIFFSAQLVYKATGYRGKMLFMLMPCNVLWTVWAMLCFCPLSVQAMHIMHQLIIPFTSLAVVAVATPDTSDLTMFLEVEFFFLMHYALIAYPIYFARSGRVSVLPLPTSNDGVVKNFMKWWTLACAYFALFYFGIATPLSIMYGINLNYMLQPPPNPGDMVSGPNFRLQSTLCCAAAFFFVQFVATAAAIFGKARIGTSSNAKKGV